MLFKIKVESWPIVIILYLVDITCKDWSAVNIKHI